MLPIKLNDLPEKWDIIIIGGGISGAGIFHEATKLGIKALLLEQNDFAWGTSSRSSKLVHGGFRYLRQGKLGLTRTSVVHRQRLIKEAPGLVEPLSFFLPVFKKQNPGKWMLGLGMMAYDLMALKNQHRFYGTKELLKSEPHLCAEGLLGGFHFYDAQVDDSRLVLRLIQEGIGNGGAAANYLKVKTINRDRQGHVVGVDAEDVETGDERNFFAPVVINATGPWTDQLHPLDGTDLHVRLLRGSHLVFSSKTFPVSHAISFLHPEDNRFIFTIPLEGVVLFGTTDLEHEKAWVDSPKITEAEVLYLLKGIHAFFPSLKITRTDCISSFAGVRTVFSKSEKEPSSESREHFLRTDKGLISVAGGKLTTFRKIAWDVLKLARPYLSSLPPIDTQKPLFSNSFNSILSNARLSEKTILRLFGRYGKGTEKIIQEASSKDLDYIPGTPTLWAELTYVSKYEQVRHLSDILLRRVRLGVILPRGGETHVQEIRNLCQSALGWDDARWEHEQNDYMHTIEENYAPPGKGVHSN
jgi:glycerol-3-phosphate dehydrogenase